MLAVALGIGGIAVLMGGPSFGNEKLPGIALALAAAMLLLTGAMIGRKPAPMPFTAFVAWQVGLGCLPMILLSQLISSRAFSPFCQQGACGSCSILGRRADGHSAAISHGSRR